jgi:predicted small lipoprotein YifL
MKIKFETYKVLLTLAAILLTGCGVKTAPNAPVESHLSDRQQSATDETERTIDPILNVVLERIELPADFNPYYGKSYFGITENNQAPPSTDEYAADPLFWIPGWEIKTERYHNGEAESYQVLLSSEARETHRERLTASMIEKQSGPLTDAQKTEIGETIFAADGLSNLHVAKYFASLGSGTRSTALLYAEKSHEENPDDFHTLWVLAHLQYAQCSRHLENYEFEKKYERLAASSYQRLIDMNPNVARVWYEYAKVAPSHAEVLAAYEKSFELDPTLYYGDSLVRLARMHADLDRKKAVAYLQQWDVIFPNEHALFLIEGIEEDGGWRAGGHHH